MSASTVSSFQAANSMIPADTSESGLRAFTFTKTILSESLKFLRSFHEHVAAGFYGADAQRYATRLGNPYTFSQCLKEIAVAQIHLTLSEQKICEEQWFNEFMAASGWLLDQLVLASPVHEILTSHCVTGNRGICSLVAESSLRASGLNECASYWIMKDEISTFIEHGAALRQRLLQYALTQEPGILQDYVFTIQFFE